MKAKILIVDDDPVIRESLTELLSGRNFTTMEAADGATGLAIVQRKGEKRFIPDLVLLDVKLPDSDGMELLTHFKKLLPEVVVIIITGHGSVPQSVDAMRQGAVDYLLKPFNVDDIVIRIQKALEGRSLRTQVDYLKKKVYGDWGSKYVLGPNPAMKKIVASLDKVACSGSSTVLITGETGTGKEVIAQRIHQLSPRANKPFVAINAAALTSELLESELFGHEAGSFTGATKTKKGLFEIADGGTLFLDEIGDMDLVMQAKILRALEERNIRRVGGTESIDVDIRLLTATHRNLQEAIHQGDFREDLYYRLSVVPIHLPALRERSDDIETLVNHFLRAFQKDFCHAVESIEVEAIETLKRYPWPGNIRELRNLLERAILLECDGSVLKKEHLKFSGRSETGLGGVDGGGSGLLGTEVPLERIEREHITGVLSFTNGNKHQTAQILGIDRTTLYNKLKKYKI